MNDSNFEMVEFNISSDDEQNSNEALPVFVMEQEESNASGAQCLVNLFELDTADASLLSPSSELNQEEDTIEYLEDSVITNSPGQPPETLINVDIQSKLFEDFMEVFITYRCKECSFIATDQDLFNQHCIQHLIKNNVEQENEKYTDEKLFFLCSHCNNAFNSPEDIKEHMIQDHSLKKDDDKHCQVNPVTTINVYIEASDDAKRVKKKRKQSDIIQNIDPSGNFNLNYACSKKGCNIKFSNKDDLNIHDKCHVPNDSESVKGKKVKNSFRCYICNELFTLWRNCSSHLYKSHEINCDLLTCPVCKVYKTPVALRLENHIRIHSDVRAFACRHCGKRFKQAAQLRNHSVLHDAKDKASVPNWCQAKQCNICFKMYSDSKCLKKHKEEVHGKLRPYVCNVCGHASARKAMLEMHQRQHNGHKPFQCDLCEFKTADHNSFRRHNMRHTGVRPYKCPHCSYSAIQSSSYKNHLKLVHPDMGGTYMCEVCMYNSVSEDNYIRHISDHLTGVIKDEDNLSEEELRARFKNFFPENIMANTITQALKARKEELSDLEVIEISEDNPAFHFTKDVSDTIDIDRTIVAVNDNSEEPVDIMKL